MDILLRIPDDLAQQLGTAGEVERRALEALAAHEYRLGNLTESELRRLLDFESNAPLNDFLRAHEGGSPSGCMPGALDEETRARARAAAEDIIRMSKGVTLGGMKIKDLINEGRR
jgi:hypothetical protein